MIDVVTVFHNTRNLDEALLLEQALLKYEPKVKLIMVNNMGEHNIGFGPGCNKGAKAGNAPVIGFLNPDVTISGTFSDQVLAAFEDPDVAIVGENFGKPEWEYTLWGCTHWICGAAFFVRREWWNQVGGFDENYKWGWEETDLIRLAQHLNKRVVPISLPLSHASPDNDTPEDVAYKRHHFQVGSERFYNKWGRHG